MEGVPPNKSFSKTDQERDNFSTNYACRHEMNRVKNTLIISMGKDDAARLDDKLKSDILKKMNIELKDVPSDRRPSTPYKKYDLVWTKIRSPTDGANAQNIMVRLELKKPFSKKFSSQL